MSNLKMPDINNVLIAGTVESDIDLQNTSTGTTASFLLSANRKYRDNSGIWRESTCQVGVTASNKIADYCGKSLKKGDSVLIDGELESRSLDTDNGSARNIVELRARHLQILETRTMQSNTSVTAEEDKSASEEAQTNKTDESTETRQIDPTDFDFGYQNLKL